MRSNHRHCHDPDAYVHEPSSPYLLPKECSPNGVPAFVKQLQSPTDNEPDMTA